MSLAHNLAFVAKCYIGKIHFYVISNHFKLLVLIKRLPFLVLVGGCGFSQDIITIKLPEIILKYYKKYTNFKDLFAIVGLSQFFNKCTSIDDRLTC